MQIKSLHVELTVRSLGTVNRIPRPSFSSVAALLLAVTAIAACGPRSVESVNPTGTAAVGPPHGTLLIAGGGRLGAEIMTRFVELAGGSTARIVIIPTAGEQEEFNEEWSGYDIFRRLGVRNLTILHTRSRREADREEFVEPLRKATGVWLPGGRQGRLAEAYLDTRTHRELFALLDRGGVIGGTSAGASIQTSYMVRGSEDGNQTIMAEGRERGFGFLRNTAVDQHLLARGRQDDLLDVIRRYPDLLGIGIDEGTAIVVRGDRAEVIGRSRVAFYNANDAAGAPYYFLESGDVFDLARRVVAKGTRSPALTPEQRAVLTTIERLFDAIRQADTAGARKLFHPEARIAVPSTRNGQPWVRASTVDEFVKSIANQAAPSDERFSNAEVRIDGPLASVWTYYDFYIGERFSHCGIDAFHLARSFGGWQILQVSYTTRQDGCRRRGGG
jgi:cyanophycinase